MPLYGITRQGRHAQRIFVAGHLDDLGEIILLLNFGNGQTGNIGLQGKNFLPRTDLKHVFSTAGHGGALGNKRIVNGPRLYYGDAALM